MLAVIFGIQGVGKTSLANEILGRVDIERIHWGSYSEKLAKERGLIKNIDELRKIDVKIQKELQQDAVQLMAEHMQKNPKKDYLLDTHSALKTSQGYLPCFNQTTIDILKPDIFIVVETAPEVIWKRRQNDPTRDRAHDMTIDEVRTNLETTRWYASTFAVLASATLFIVENEEGDVDHAAKQIIDVLQKFKKQ